MERLLYPPMSFPTWHQEHEDPSVEAHSKWNIWHPLYSKFKHLKSNKIKNHAHKRNLLPNWQIDLFVLNYFCSDIWKAILCDQQEQKSEASWPHKSGGPDVNHSIPLSFCKPLTSLTNMYLSNFSKLLPFSKRPFYLLSGASYC